MNSLTVLQSHVVATSSNYVTHSNTEERFLDGFGISWNINFHRMSSQIICFWGHLENNWLSTRSLFAFNICHSVVCVRLSYVTYVLWLNGAPHRKYV